MSADQYLRGVRAVVLEQGMGKGRARILCRHLKTKGGSVLPGLSDAATHILVGNNVRRSRLPVLLGVAEIPSEVHVLRADWLSSCLVHGELVGEEEFCVPLETVSAGSSKDREEGRLLKSGREKREGEATSGVSGSSSVTAAAEREGRGEGEGGVDDRQCVAERVSVTDSTSPPFHSFLCCSFQHRHSDGLLITQALAKREHLLTQIVTMWTLVGKKRVGRGRGRVGGRRGDWPKSTLVPYLL